MHDVDERAWLARPLHDSIDVRAVPFGHRRTGHALRAEGEHPEVTRGQRRLLVGLARDALVLREDDPAALVGVGNPLRVGDAFIFAVGYTSAMTCTT